MPDPSPITITPRDPSEPPGGPRGAGFVEPQRDPVLESVTSPAQALQRQIRALQDSGATPLTVTEEVRKSLQGVQLFAQLPPYSQRRLADEVIEKYQRSTLEHVASFITDTGEAAADPANVPASLRAMSRIGGALPGITRDEAETAFLQSPTARVAATAFKEVAMGAFWFRYAPALVGRAAAALGLGATQAAVTAGKATVAGAPERSVSLAVAAAKSFAPPGKKLAVEATMYGGLFTLSNAVHELRPPEAMEFAANTALVAAIGLPIMGAAGLMREVGRFQTREALALLRSNPLVQQDSRAALELARRLSKAERITPSAAGRYIYLTASNKADESIMLPVARALANSPDLFDRPFMQHLAASMQRITATKVSTGNIDQTFTRIIYEEAGSREVRDLATSSTKALDNFVDLAVRGKIYVRSAEGPEASRFRQFAQPDVPVPLPTDTPAAQNVLRNQLVSLWGQKGVSPASIPPIFMKGRIVPTEVGDILGVQLADGSFAVPRIAAPAKTVTLTRKAQELLATEKVVIELPHPDGGFRTYLTEPVAPKGTIKLTDPLTGTEAELSADVLLRLFERHGAQIAPQKNAGAVVREINAHRDYINPTKTLHERLELTRIVGKTEPITTDRIQQALLSQTMSPVRITGPAAPHGSAYPSNDPVRLIAESIGGRASKLKDGAVMVEVGGNKVTFASEGEAFGALRRTQQLVIERERTLRMIANADPVPIGLDLEAAEPFLAAERAMLGAKPAPAGSFEAFDTGYVFPSLAQATFNDARLFQFGPHGRELGARLARGDRLYGTAMNRWLDEGRKILKTLTPEEYAGLHDFMVLGTPGTANQAAAAKRLRALGNEGVTEGLKIGLPVERLEPNYFPKYHDQTRLKTDPAYRQMMLDAIKTDHGPLIQRFMSRWARKGQFKTIDEAAEAVLDLLTRRGTGQKSASLEYRRLSLPGYEKDPLKAFTLMFHQNARRLGYAKAIGVRHEIAHDLIAKLPPGQRESAQKIYEVATQAPVIVPRLYRELHTSAATLLTWTAVPNMLQQHFNIFIKTGLRDWIGSLARTGLHPIAIRAAAKEAGALTQSLVSEVHEIGYRRLLDPTAVERIWQAQGAWKVLEGLSAANQASARLSAYPLALSEEVLRTWAFEAGRSNFRRLLSAYEKGVKGWQLAGRKIEEFYQIDPANALSILRNQPDKFNVLETIAGLEMANATQFVNKPLTRVRPFNFTQEDVLKNPGIAHLEGLQALGVQYRTFTMNQTRLMSQELLAGPMGRGWGRTARAVSVLTVFLPPLAAIGIKLRKFVSTAGKEDTNATVKAWEQAIQDEDVVNYLGYSLALSSSMGGMGILTDFAALSVMNDEFDFYRKITPPVVSKTWNWLSLTHAAVSAGVAQDSEEQQKQLDKVREAIGSEYGSVGRGVAEFFKRD